MTAERRGPRLNLLGIATALMIALAGGAIWALAALWRQETLAFLALPVGFVIGRTLAVNGPRNAVLATSCAFVFSLVASAYALWMIASGRVAMLLGMRLTDIFGAIGLDLAAAVAWARLDAFDIACLIGAALLAAFAAVRGQAGTRPNS